MPQTDYERVQTAIEYVLTRFSEQPTVDEIARSVHLSPYHFSRLFKRWAGVTPKQFLQHTTLEYAKALLADSRSVLDVAHESGLSGPGRLHDHFVTVDAVTPGEFKSGGRGASVAYGIHETRFGTCLIGSTPRGICRVRFLDAGETTEAVEAFRREWPHALVCEDADATRQVADGIGASGPHADCPPLLLRGTNFQLQVWRALLAIPPGRVVSYGDVGALIGRPKASRAVGAAVGANPVASLIPCHRVLRKNGAFGGYRWGVARKVAMLGWEAVSAAASEDASDRV